MKPLACLLALLSIGVSAFAADSKASLPSTLGELVERSENIYVVVYVARVGVGTDVEFKNRAVLKGKALGESLTFTDLANNGSGTFPDALPHWAKVQRTAVVFIDSKNREEPLVCVGNTWCVARMNKAGQWRYWQEPAELGRIYLGSTEKLREHVEAILKGKEVVITAQAPEPMEEYGPGPIPRDWVRGRKGRIWRIKAGPGIRANPMWERSRNFVGWGVGGEEDLPRLLKGLEAADPAARAESAEDLGRLGPAAKPALADLRKACEDTDEHVRVFAAEAVLRLDPEDQRARPVLAKALKSIQVPVRRAAVSSVASLGARAASLAPDLVQLVEKEPSDSTRAGACFALKEILRETGGAPELARLVIPALAEATRPTVDGEVRFQAMRALLKCGPETKTIRPALTRALRDDRPSYKIAADLLTRLGHGSANALAEGALDTYSPSSRLAAIEALGNLGPDGRAGLIALLGIMKENDANLRFAAAIAAYRLEPARGDRLAIETLRTTLPTASVDDSTRYSGLFSLADLGPAAHPLVPSLIQELQSSDNLRRSEAVALLEAIGPKAVRACPALQQVTRKYPSGAGPEAEVARLDSAQAAVALWRIDRQFEKPLLHALLWGELAEKNHEEKFAEQPLKVLPQVREALKDECEHLRAGAACALRYLGPDAQLDLPELTKLLSDKQEEVRTEAALTILSLDPKHAEARSALRASPNGQRLLARYRPVLARLDHDWLVSLIEELKPAETARPIAFGVLRELTKTPKAVPLLRKLLKSENPGNAARAAICLFLYANDRAPLLALLDKHPELILELPTNLRLEDEDRRVLAAKSSAWLLGATRSEDAQFSRKAQRCLVQLDAAAAARAWDTGEPRNQAMPWDNLDTAHLDRLWKDLASDDDRPAIRAMWTLALAGKPAAEYLRKRLPVVSAGIPPEITKLIAELDHEEFSVREKATQELMKAGEVGEWALKRALAKDPPLEVRNRGERILRHLSNQKRPERVRTVRAFEALEHNDSAEARAALEAVGRGTPESAITQAALEALRRHKEHSTSANKQP